MKATHEGMTLAALSVERRRLVERMQQLEFGDIQGLKVVAGEPVFDRRTRTIRQIKLTHGHENRRGCGPRDFVLKAEVVELLHRLDQIRDGTILSLEVRHGLPVTLRVEDAV